MILSASWMVDRRWAITKLVLSCFRSAIAFWIKLSVRVSTELVASSRMRISGSAKKARAIVKSCLYPWEIFVPSSFNRVSAGCMREMSSEKVKTLAKSMVLSRWPTCMAWWEAK